jgi:polyisoprenoid-binding protein YceI
MTATLTLATPRRRAAAWLVASAVCAAAFAERGAGAATERGAWRIDPARTHIGFVVDAVGFPRTQGEFHVFNGRLSIDFDRPAASRVSFTVRSDSIEVEVKRLGGARLSFVAHTHIDRLAYGMNSGFPIISRDVDLTVSSEALAG